MNQKSIHILGIYFVVMGAIFEIPWMIALVTGLWAMGLAVSEFLKIRHDIISPIFIYEFFTGIRGFSNTIGLLNENTGLRHLYFLYVDERFLLEAMVIDFVGSFFIILGFNALFYAKRQPVSLPVLKNIFSAAFIQTWLPVLALSIIALKFTNFDLGALGTIGFIVEHLPYMIIFTLARYGGLYEKRNIYHIALVLAMIEAWRALLWEFLRFMIVLPLIAFVLGVILGNKSLRPLKWPVFVPVYGAVVLFVLFAGTFGSLRRSMGYGTQRIDALMSETPRDVQNTQHVIARFTTINQLSQVFRVVKEDGFYRGKTLSYLTFVFIPRFLWPAKPKIAMGRWFAYRISIWYNIGQPINHLDYTNSVNMTIPGELYLNFNWIGVVLGCLLIGALFALLWQPTLFWQEPDNVLGNMFGFFILLQMKSFGADMQIIVTAIAMYLLFLFISWFTTLRDNTD